MKNKKSKKSWFQQWYVLHDSTGRKSISYTMVVYSFFAVLFWFVISIAEEILGVKIREFSGSEAALFLSPILAIYFGRKGQKGNQQDATEEGSVENNDEAGTEESK